MKQATMLTVLTLTVMTSICSIVGCAADLHETPDTADDVQIGTNKQAGGFYGTCDNVLVVDNRLEGLCADREGIKRWSALGLDLGIANDDGRLRWQPYGGYSGSCGDCILDDSTYLICSCRRVDGTWNRTGLNLDRMISNQNSVLAFDFPL